MKTYCYHVRAPKLSGGMLHAESLDDAAKRAIQVNKLTLSIKGTRGFPRIEWLRDGKKVYLYVSVHADHFLDAETKRAIDELPE